MDARPKPNVFTKVVTACLVLTSVCVLSAAGLEGVFSKRQTEHGARLFKEKCSACHGGELEGGDHGPPLKDDGFWQEWNGQPARALYSRIISTMPPDDAGSLKEKDVIDILAHLAAVNGAAFGTKEPERADQLNAIILERPK